jgi:hypothetical protein
MKKVTRILLPFILFSYLFIMGMGGHEAHASLASVDSVTVTLTGPAVRFLSPTGFFAGNDASASGNADSNPFTTVPLADTRVASAVGLNSAAEAKGVDFSASGSGFTIVFHSLTAWSSSAPEAAAAHVYAGIDFTVVGDPEYTDDIIMEWSFPKATIAAEGGVARLTVSTYISAPGTYPNRGGQAPWWKYEVRDFYEGDTIQVGPWPKNLGLLEDGDTIVFRVYPEVYASSHTPVPFPPAALLLGSVLLPLLYVRRKKRGQ